MKENKLFDIPSDTKSTKSRITEFKHKNRIWTNRQDHMKDAPWCALKINEDEPLTPLELISTKAGSLFEQGRWVTGKGELSVIRELCQNLNIPCDL